MVSVHLLQHVVGFEEGAQQQSRCTVQLVNRDLKAEEIKIIFFVFKKNQKLNSKDNIEGKETHLMVVGTPGALWGLAPVNGTAVSRVART